MQLSLNFYSLKVMKKAPDYEIASAIYPLFQLIYSFEMKYIIKK